MHKIILPKIRWGAALPLSGNNFKWALFPNYVVICMLNNSCTFGVLLPGVAKFSWTIPTPHTIGHPHTPVKWVCMQTLLGLCGGYWYIGYMWLQNMFYFCIDGIGSYLDTESSHISDTYGESMHLNIHSGLRKIKPGFGVVSQYQKVRSFYTSIGLPHCIYMQCYCIARCRN